MQTQRRLLMISFLSFVFLISCLNSSRPLYPPPPSPHYDPHDRRWVNYIVEAPTHVDSVLNISMKPMKMRRLRESLPAHEDVLSPHPNRNNVCRIVPIQIEKIHIEDWIHGATAKDSMSRDETGWPRSSTKKFDRHMKQTRRNSRQNVLGLAMLPSLEPLVERKERMV
jgi:hypothetical protein